MKRLVLLAAVLLLSGCALLLATRRVQVSALEGFPVLPEAEEASSSPAENGNASDGTSVPAENGSAPAGKEAASGSFSAKEGADAGKDAPAVPEGEAGSSASSPAAEAGLPPEPPEPTQEGDSLSEPAASPEPAEADFVKVTDYIPQLLIDLRYGSEDNFTGQTIYDFTDAYLRYGTVRKLAAVQTALEEEGYGLKIWDAFRPPAAQFKLWEICPDSRYVANPNQGASSHSRGNTVDLTLVDRQGHELEMPTGFDDFSPKADRDYRDVPPQAAENARRLEAAMTAQGFQPYSEEWWHYADETRYPVEETFVPPSRDGGEEEPHA